MKYKNIDLTREDNVVILSINRPHALNALNKGVLDELEYFFQKEAKPENMDGIVITGSGEKSFVAGADIKELLALDEEKAVEMTTKVHNIYFSIERFQKPVIAAVNGFALGGGCELAMACHMRVAGKGARFGQPEVNLGIIPGYGGTQRLIQLIGKGKAIEMMMTGDMINAATALGLGLANHVVEQGEEVNKAKEIIKKIAKRAPLAIAEIVNTSNAFFDKSKDGFSEEIKAFGRLAVTADFKEGASAFIEKRRAEWKGE